jgi:hypothetical protein
VNNFYFLMACDATASANGAVVFSPLQEQIVVGGAAAANVRVDGGAATAAANGLVIFSPVPAQIDIFSPLLIVRGTFTGGAAAAVAAFDGEREGGKWGKEEGGGNQPNAIKGGGWGVEGCVSTCR